MIHDATWPQSRNIESATYDDEKFTLDITFKRGAEYRYYAVPRQVWLDFVHAQSPGSFFSAHIKDVFDYERI